MPLLSDSFLEMIALAAVPGHHTGPGAAAAAGAVEHPYQSPAHAAIGFAIDQARDSGRRAAVCVVDLPTPPAAGQTTPGALEASVASCLRRGDRQCRLGNALVVVSPDLDHPAQGDRLAERLRARTGFADAAVGLALYPAHGGDAASLLDSARASALRARLARRGSDPEGISPGAAG